MATPGSQVTLSAELGLASGNGYGGLLAQGSALSGQTLAYAYLHPGVEHLLGFISSSDPAEFDKLLDQSAYAALIAESA